MFYQPHIPKTGSNFVMLSRPAPRGAMGKSADAALLAHVLRGDPTRARQLLRQLSRPHHADLPRALAGAGLIDADDLAKMTAGRAGLMSIDPRDAPPDPRLADRWGVARCLSDGILPWHRCTDGTVILAHDPHRFAELRPALIACFGPVVPAFSTQAAMSETLLSLRGADIAKAAEARVAARESCRALDAGRLSRALAAVALPLMLLCIFAPMTAFGLLLALAFLAMAGQTILKASALWSAMTAPKPPPAAQHVDDPRLLPMISVIVALYREDSIAARLVQRLGHLDYPRDRMEALLVVEDDDRLTRAALLAADLPHWVRIIIAPKGSIRTKPRALNIALDQCRGSIVGVYDAEDAPEPDQLRKVARRFATAPADVVCLQGTLDFYNSQKNIMSRLFTLEYAAWFRLVLPGFDRLGLVLPLGGTTLFFRRAALDRLGAWDAHNVTEDADLGLRLARHGWRTAMLDTTTFEEANARALPWVKQRSRWIKGYMMTWAVHMRQPRLLWGELGAKKFIAVQAHFAGSLAQSLLAPLLWSLWALPLGLPHPLTALLPHGAILLLAGLMICSKLVDLSLSLSAWRRLNRRVSPLWILAQPAYNALATLAAYKALWELVTRPFYWDKTTHGTFGG